MGKFCQNCGAELIGDENFCSSCGNSPTSTISNKPSIAWYLLPFFFSLIGGIIGYFAVKSRDKEMAQNLLRFGLIMMIFTWIIMAL